MAVLDFKPNLLSYRIQNAGYTDSNGDYHEGSYEWSPEIKCDSVPNSGGANVVLGEDGNTVKYSFTIFLPTSVKNFKFGEVVRLMRYGTVYELTVKGFQRYQKQVKLWV